MTKVFFCTVERWGAHTIRGYFRDACRLAWIKMDDAHIHPLYGYDVPDFQRTRRMDADKLAPTDIYVLTDDDMLPIGEDFIARGVALMQKYPGFGMLSALPTNAMIQFWNPENHKPLVNDEVMEHYSVGGLRFCRRGIVKKWPVQNGKGYDADHCAAIRDAGYSVGYMRDVRANHLGEGFSTIWQ